MESDHDRALPYSKSARERFRDSYRLEAQQLERVIAAERRLDLARERADAAMARMRETVSDEKAQRDAAVVELARTAGADRAAAMLGMSPTEVRRLIRKPRGSSARRSDVQA